MTIQVSSLFTVESAAKILDRGLEVARSVGLLVDTWRTGDPTRSLYKYLADVLNTYEEIVAQYIRSGFRSTAEGDWFTVLAKEVYGVDRVEATFATPTITLSNGGGGHYEIESDGDLTVKSSATDKTFHNTSTGTLAAGSSAIVFELVADEAGSDSTVAVDELDTLITTLLGVTIDSSTAATATDEQSDPSLDDQCGDTLGALSPNGPPDAYQFVARSSDLTGVTDVTRAKSIADDDTGDVTLYVASDSGAVAGASVTAVQAAIEEFATPLCITPTVVNSTPVTVDVTATIEGVDIPTGFEATISAALVTKFKTINISDGTESIAKSLIVAEIHKAIPEADR